MGTIVYLSSFLLSRRRVGNPNLYPYCVFRDKYIDPFVFSPVTVFYGNNGCGKSTLLNLIAQKLGIRGAESYAYGQGEIDRFLEGCLWDPGTDDYGITCRIPDTSVYIKSEDILYEIKKIQQEEALSNGYIYEQVRSGMNREQALCALHSRSGSNSRLEILQFAQEKYSNGETAMHLLFDELLPDTLYLLDEPEVSLSPQNQIKLAEEINKYARLLGCQFIIASHSPFMLGILNGRIYDMDDPDMSEKRWTELENVRFIRDFFREREGEFHA